MTVEAIKKILLSVRPERPRSTERRKLQCAIDETFKLLDNYEALINQAEVTIYEDGATLGSGGWINEVPSNS